MTISVDSASPASLTKGSTSSMGSPPLFSPSSDKRFWSALRSRIDTLLENRNPGEQSLLSSEMAAGAGAAERAKRKKEDAMLLLRGFDSVASSLSHLSNNLENALQGARDLAKPPTLTEIVQCAMEKVKSGEEKSEKQDKGEAGEKDDGKEGKKRGTKRKIDAQQLCEDKDEEDELHEETKLAGPKELGKTKKAKNLAISMATKAASLARELKSLRSDLCFMQERTALLEEENRRLRDGFAKGIRPEEDDLVRLQLEALLAEKSRLANENANLTRENQCLRQLVEYHQFASQDLSASYENLLRGMCIDFSSPIEEKENCEEADPHARQGPNMSRDDVLGLSKSLEQFYDEEQQ